MALKILDKTRLDNHTHRLLSKEIISMECLHHPNVVCLYEVVETPSRLYLVLEYAGGGDLHNRITTDGKMSDNSSKVTFAQILSAIKYMVSDICVWFSNHSSFVAAGIARNQLGLNTAIVLPALFRPS